MLMPQAVLQTFTLELDATFKVYLEETRCDIKFALQKRDAPDKVHLEKARCTSSSAL